MKRWIALLLAALLLLAGLTACRDEKAPESTAAQETNASVTADAGETAAETVEQPAESSAEEPAADQSASQASEEEDGGDGADLD